MVIGTSATNNANPAMERPAVAQLHGIRKKKRKQRLSSQHFAALSTPNIAELVLFGFFYPQP